MNLLGDDGKWSETHNLCFPISFATGAFLHVNFVYSLDSPLGQSHLQDSGKRAINLQLDCRHGNRCWNFLPENLWALPAAAAQKDLIVLNRAA
jgi:hypothetical protein